MKGTGTVAQCDSLASSTKTEADASAGLYVDTENLGDKARSLVESGIDDWPDKALPVARLNVYVEADRVQLWEMWATSRFPKLAVRVHGIQHFTERSKNTADIALAVDAIADFVSGRTKFVAVMSDDSDFISLYAKLRDLTGGSAPFLWMITNRTGSQASAIRDFLPDDYIHVVRVAPTTGARPKSAEVGKLQPEITEMAELIVREIPPGSFKSSDCQPIIGKNWPSHAMSNMSSANFGTEFANKLWPILKEQGVKLTGTKPRRYEMPKGG